MHPTIAVFDVDGTLRTVADPWLHLHNHLGTIEHGRQFYRRWSSGEISYARMAELDASVWKGVDRGRMLECLKSNPLRQGARRLVRWFKDRAVPCVGISTGLSLFNEITARESGLDDVVSNDLLFSGRTCTGKIVVNVEEDRKGDALRRVLERYRVDGASMIAFGDGRADLAMFEMASLAVAVFPRSEEVSRKADLVIESEPIDAICERLASIYG
jgi:phosphoserine phosphatase